jgi:acyl carrier protein
MGAMAGAGEGILNADSVDVLISDALSSATGLKVEQSASDVLLEDLGIDSVVMTSMIGQLEVMIGFRFEPDVLLGIYGAVDIGSLTGVIAAALLRCKA